jgi:prepilin-type N-terminal cleavage/methylation domain-containing protein
MSGASGRRAQGFSLVELLVVLAITVVVAAIAVPQMLTAAAIYRLHTRASDLAAMLQRARSLAVKVNTPVGVSLSGATFSLVSAASPSGLNSMQLVLPSQLSVATTGMPASLTTTALEIPSTASISIADSDTPAYFNARGLPCPYDSASGTCNSANSNTAYVYYLQATGNGGWAAVSVSPSGRVKAWTWDGSAWK